jgi:hypothetical protein
MNLLGSVIQGPKFLPSVDLLPLGALEFASRSSMYSHKRRFRGKINAPPRRIIWEVFMGQPKK